MFWKRCKHDWKLINEELFELGMNKIFTYQCNKCSKLICVTLGTYSWWRKHNKDGSLR